MIEKSPLVGFKSLVAGFGDKWVSSPIEFSIL